MDKVGECRGDRGGNVYHVYDGYFYRINHNDSVRKYLACVRRMCPGRASMPADMADRIINNFRMTGLHNHPPNLNRLALSRLKETLIHRSESELTPIKQIYDEEIAKVPEEVTEMLTYRVYRSTMQRCRKLVQRAIISALQEDVNGEDLSELDYEGNPLSRNEAAEFADFEEQLDIAVIAKRKRAGTKAFLKKSDLKRRKLFEYKDYMDYDETEYLEEEQTEQEYDDAEYAEYDEDENDAKCKTDTEEGALKDEEARRRDLEVQSKDGNVSNNVNEQTVEGEYVLGGSNGYEEENNYTYFLVENEVEIGTSEIITDSVKKSPAATNSPKKSVTHLMTNKNEEIKETFQEYIQLQGSKPKLRDESSDDLLSTFFREVEETVRSFLPSVIIEAKGKIANLINRLEMRNWQVQQVLKEKEEKQMQQLRKTQVKENQQPPQQKEKIQQYQTKPCQQQKEQVQQIKQMPRLTPKPQLQKEIQPEQFKERLKEHQPAQEEEPEQPLESLDPQQKYRLQEPVPVVLKYGPNVSVICLPNEISAFSQPLIKVREMSSLQGQPLSDS